VNVISPTFNFGSIQLYALLTQSDEFLLEKNENYQKRSERNRFEIVNHLGKLSLSIPLLKGKNNMLPISEVRIAYEEDWRNYHLKSIEAAYRKSPFYEFYIDRIKLHYNEKHTYLWDFNTNAINLIKSILKITNNTIFTDTYSKEYSEIYIDLRQKKINFEPILKPYNQVFEDRLPFIPNVSILDLIFCLGPESKKYLSELEFK
jgi:hypothetical protein